jgi:hypothetical protein
MLLADDSHQEPTLDLPLSKRSPARAPKELNDTPDESWQTKSHNHLLLDCPTSPTHKIQRVGASQTATCLFVSGREETIQENSQPVSHLDGVQGPSALDECNESTVKSPAKLAKIHDAGSTSSIFTSMGLHRPETVDALQASASSPGTAASVPHMRSAKTKGPGRHKKDQPLPLTDSAIEVTLNNNNSLRHWLGMSHSAQHARKVCEAAQTGSLHIGKSKLLMWKSKVRVVDWHAKFIHGDLLKVCHSTCRKFVHVDKPYDVTKFRKHTKNC